MPLDPEQLANQLFSTGLTACFTIVGGVTVLVAGQLVLKFFIEPILEQSKLLSEIAHSLTYYANFYGNANLFEKEEMRAASDTFLILCGSMPANLGLVLGQSRGIGCGNY